MSLLSNTLLHMRRSPYQATAAILTMFLTLLLAGIFFIASIASVYILQFFESKPQITVFFNDKAGATDAAALRKSLEETGKTASMKFVSKEDALKIYREQNKNDPLLLEMVTADILPASLEVTATDPKYLAELEPVIKGAQGVDEVVFQKDVVNALIAWTQAIRLVGGILAGLLALDSILIVMTVIGMKIALKKNEIEILTLVGASPWYIRAPFILEGGFYGITAAVVSSVIILGLIIWLQPFLLSFLGTIPVIHAILISPTSAPFLISSAAFTGALVLTGFILGGVGSLIAVSRYIKF